MNRVVFITGATLGSTGSFVPGPFNSVYCGTKAFVYSFSQALSEEFKNTSVNVTTLCPGATKTNFARNSNMEKSKIFKNNVMDPEKVAKAGYNAIIKKGVLLQELEIK